MALPTQRAASNRFGQLSRLDSPWVLMRSASRLSAPCVMARLPADISTITRSPARSNTVVLRKVLIWSTPALVRESDRNTRPASSSIATQYVMWDPVVR